MTREESPAVRIAGVKCIAASERAILCIVDGEEHWIPQSQVTADSEVYGLGHEGELVVTGWLARRRGWS